MEPASVDIEYGDEELRRAATVLSFRPEGWSSSLLSAYREAVQVLHAAVNAQDLRALRCLRFEETTEGAAACSIRVNADHRLFFKVSNANNGPLARVFAVAPTDRTEGAQQ